MRIVVFAAGNDARGDDALGPLLARRLAALGYAKLTVHDDYQFQLEHALDLPADGMALFIDAHCGQAEAVRFEALAPAEPDAGTHSLTPQQVMGVARRIGAKLPPAWLLSLRARSFELGAPLSPPASAVLGEGWGLLRSLLGRPCARHWARVSALRLSAC